MRKRDDAWTHEGGRVERGRIQTRKGLRSSRKVLITESFSVPNFCLHGAALLPQFVTTICIPSCTVYQVGREASHLYRITKVKSNVIDVKKVMYKGTKIGVVLFNPKSFYSGPRPPARAFGP
jgi:hypothetical protein